MDVKNGDTYAHAYLSGRKAGGGAKGPPARGVVGRGSGAFCGNCRRQGACALGREGREDKRARRAWRVAGFRKGYDDDDEEEERKLR